MLRHTAVLAVAIAGLAGLPMSLSGAIPGVVMWGPVAAPDIDARVREVVAGSGGKIELGTIGTSRGGKAIHLLRLGDEKKPALLIVAGLNAMHSVGVDAALGVASKLASDHAEVLAKHSVFIIPCADPDGAARVPGMTPKRDSARTIAPVDDDHDGRVDEDAPQDLNGDGIVGIMRVYNPPPQSGIEATDIIDPDNPRLTKKPDKMKGEVANVAVLVEGRDTDGDGLIGEDGPDGVDMTMNFPWKWPEFQAGAGPTALSEPETRAIAAFLTAHDNIVAVLVYGPHDTLVKTPEAGRMDQTGRIPEGIENEDKAYWEEVGKLFKDATKMTGAPTGNPAGSLHGWAYAHLGLYSFSTPVWVRPDLVKKDDAAPAPAPEAAPAQPSAPAGPTDAEIQALVSEFQNAPREQRRALMEKLRAMPQEVQDRVRASMGPPGGGGGRGGAGGPRGGGPGGRRPGGGGAGGSGGNPSDPEDAKWLKYSDDQRGGGGFMAFKTFEHPDLGPVEIGGFVPGFKMTPPAEEVPALVDQQTAFVTQLLSKLPNVEAQEPVVEEMGGGLFRVTFRVVNTGYLPTRTALAQKARRVPPLRIQLDLPEDRVVSGDRLTRIQSLEGSGGARTVQWVVSGAPGSTIKVLVRSGDYGDTTIEVPLTQKVRRAGPVPEAKEPPPPPPPPPPPAPGGDASKPATTPEKEPRQ